MMGAVVSVQREMDGNIQWLSFLRNVGGESSSYTWRGALLEILLSPVSVWFTVFLVCSSRISPQLPHFFPFS